jgi:excisionase family DNA binding protein
MEKVSKDRNRISDLISQAEAARIRGVTRAAIRDLIRRQRLRSVEVGGRELVYRGEVEAFEKDKPGRKSLSSNSKRDK